MIKNSQIRFIAILFIFFLLSYVQNIYAQQRLTKSELIEYAKLLRGKRAQPVILTDGSQITIDEDCGFADEWNLRESLEASSLSDIEREEILSLLDIDGTITNYNTTHFNIQYTTDNTGDQVHDHTVDTAVDVTLACDPLLTVIGTTTGGNGHPNFVEQVGIWLEYSLEYFNDLGFNDPIPSGSRITVYIEDLAGNGSANYDIIRIDCQLSEYHMQSTPTHELFHNVQLEYDWEELWIMEGTARWSVDLVNDGLNRYMRNGTRNYLNNMDVDLTLNTNPHKYETVLFWKYFSEQHTNINTEPNIGVDAILELFDQMKTYDGIDATDRAIKNLPKGRSVYTTFKNWIIANYIKELGNPYININYDYIEDEQLECGSADGFGSVMPVYTHTLTSTSGPYSVTSTVNNWAADYYIIRPNTTVNDIKVRIDNHIGFNNPLYIILAIKDDYATVYQYRSDDYVKTFYNPPSSLDELVVIVGAYEDGGSYDLEVIANEGIPADVPIDVALVIDCSGSMDYYHYIEPVKNYGKLFVDLLQPEDRIGVVSFAVKPSPTAKAVEEYRLTEIPTVSPPEVKTEAKNALNGLTTGNTTPLGEGLMLGQQEINNYGDATHPQVIVLLSDGEENVSPYVSKSKDPASSILSDINSDGIGIYTLILGPSADWAMNILQEIAEETDGHSEYFIQTSIDFAEVYMMIRTAILQDDLLRLDKGYLGQVNTYSRIFEVDTDASTDILLLPLAWENEKSHLDIEIQPPGQTSWMNISEISADPNMNVLNEDVYQIVRISVPAFGKWRYRIKYTDVTSTQERFVCSAITDRLDINMIVNLEGSNIAGNTLLLTAKITNNNNPFIGAQVTANAKIPIRSLSSTITHLWKRLKLDELRQVKDSEFINDISVRIQIIDRLRKELASDKLVEYRNDRMVLYDNGKNGDYLANDGIYSSKVKNTNTTTAGTYTFTVNANSVPNSPSKFQRVGILNSQIDIAQIDPKKSIVRLSEISTKPDATRTIEILAIGIDEYDNTFWPGYPKQVSVKTDKGHLLGKIKDNEDTSYSQMLELRKDQDANIQVSIRGVGLPPVNTKKPPYPWNGYVFGGYAIPKDNLDNNYETDKNIILGLGYSFTHNLTVFVMGGYNWFNSKTQNISDTTVKNISANIRYSILRGRIAPYFGGGMGYYLFDESDNEFGFNLSTGVDYFINRRITAEIGGDYHTLFDTDKTKFLHTHAGIIIHF